METASLNVLDELYLHLDRGEEPWSIQLEVRAEGTIDAEQLAAAIGEAALRHPLARARLADTRGTDVRYRWEIFDELESVPLEVVDCADDGDLGRARERLLGHAPPLDRSGPFAIVLAHHPGGDALMLNLHHAAGDGLAALRLMGSIARAYAAVDDPLPPVDPLAVRDVRAIASSDSIEDFLNRARASIDYLARGVAPPTRIVADGANGKPGYGFELLTLEAARVAAHRRTGATVNDVLLAALALTVRRWNDSHAGDSGSVYLMMPLNLRPSEWRLDVIGNFASYVSVKFDGRDLPDLDTAVEAAAETTRRIKDKRIAGLIVDLFDPPTALPTAIKKRLQHLIPLTGNLVVDTAVLSNLGRLEGVPHLAEAGAIKEVWFSPPGRMPLGASLGAATLGDELFVSLRYRHALFDDSAATAFGSLFREILVS